MRRRMLKLMGREFKTDGQKEPEGQRVSCSGFNAPRGRDSVASACAPTLLQLAAGTEGERPGEPLGLNRFPGQASHVNEVIRPIRYGVRSTEDLND